MTKLSDRVAALTGSDREVDHDIYEAITGKCSHRHIMTIDGDGDCWSEVCSRCCEEEPDHVTRAYTGSIDAAMTLVPEGREAEILIEAINSNRETDWTKALPRYVASAALKARGL